MKKRNNTIVALDIGSSKIMCIVAKHISGEDIEIVGYSSHASAGIRSGIITDLQAATASINRALDDTEQAIGSRVADVYVNISPNHLLSHQLSAEIDVTGHAISIKDMNNLLFTILDKYKEQEVAVVHSFIYDYILNGNRGIVNPLGMYGNNLACDVNVLVSPSSTITNLTKCLEECQCQVKAYIASSYASGVACLSSDEMKLGATLIEIGAGCSSIAVFANNQLIFTDGISIGGHNIAEDIAKGLSITFEQAERIKILYGTVVSTSFDARDVIEIAAQNDEEEPQHILKSTLSEIIRARVEEILELLRHKLINAGFAPSNQRVVITGGSANLNGIRELVAHMFEARVRLGYAKQVKSIHDVNKNLSFVTAFGMILHVAKNVKSSVFEQSKDPPMLKKAWQWLKENFI